MVEEPANELNARVTTHLDVSDLYVSFIDSEGNDVTLSRKLQKANLEVHIIGPANQILAKQKKWTVGSKNILTTFQMTHAFRQLENRKLPVGEAFEVGVGVLDG